jgi:hypothetical protein
MEVMERREALAEIRRTRDVAALDRQIAEVRQEEARSLSSLTREFAAQAPNWQEILKHVGELRYYVRFLDEARSIADDLI